MTLQGWGFFGGKIPEVFTEKMAKMEVSEIYIDHTEREKKAVWRTITAHF